MKAKEFLESSARLVEKQDAIKAVDKACEEAVHKWTLWCFNYHTPFENVICQIWGGKLSMVDGAYRCDDNHFTQHLIEKWQSFEWRGDARMLHFYCDLDSGLKKQLVDWVMENYRG